MIGDGSNAKLWGRKPDLEISLKLKEGKVRVLLHQVLVHLGGHLDVVGPSRLQDLVFLGLCVLLHQIVDGPPLQAHVRPHLIMG